jgi:hypothetical protein
MFADVEEGSNLRDDDGAKRVFFGGERFIEGISGEAYVIIAVSPSYFINILFYYRMSRVMKYRLDV